MNKGEVLGIVGRSGSGKTTLLKCIYGLEDLAGGEIFLEEERVLGPAFNLIPGHEDMKLVSQEFYVLENHTVEENIFDKLIGYTDDVKQRTVSNLLKLVELQALRYTKAKNLSSGQKQRVAIARALAVMPKVLLLDEPFSNLDTLLSKKLFAYILKEVRRNRTSVILITHLAEEALKYADNIAVLDNGKIIELNEKWKVYYNTKNPRLAGLLGEFNLIKKEDLKKSSKLRKVSKLFLRPDKIKWSATKAGDLQLRVISCTFNGKCHELLCETKSGASVIVYAAKALAPDKIYSFQVEFNSGN